jgi:hypothetical protein
VKTDGGTPGGHSLRRGFAEHRPSGIPVGRAFTIPAGLVHDDLRKAVDEISRVHGDGVLPTIPLRLASLKTSESGDRVRRGQIVLDPSTNLPIAILVEVNEGHRGFAAVHEIGHLLDLVGIGEVGRFASPDEPLLDEWRSAMANSHAIGHLLEMSRTALDLADQGHLADLLDPIEAWARSYTQYIARRSAWSALRISLDALRIRDPTRLYYPQQWEDADFDAIDNAIERLFRRLGWQTGPLF